MELSEEDYTFDLFKTWSADALTDYCEQRGYPKTGGKSELAAMAYTAYRTGAPLQPSAIENIKSAKAQYHEKLTIPSLNIQIPDPLKDTVGWEGELTGMTKWPRIVHGDIIHYLNQKNGLDAKETLNKYKEGKAFSFFSSDFVKEVMIKKISESLCILKTCVTPSERINDIPHRVWACTTLPDGEILRAYCTCTAGLKETCCHLAGLLFRIEAAHASGLTDPTCTMKASVWQVPAAKTVVELGEIATADFVQPCAGKTKSRPLVSEAKRNFEAVAVNQIEMRAKLMAKFSKIKPNCVSSLMYKAENQPAVPVVMSTEKDKPVPAVLSLLDLVVAKSNIEQGNISSKVAAVMKKLPKPSAYDIKEVSSLTMHQGKNPSWGQARQGRITASNFGKVVKRFNTLTSNTTNQSKDPAPILSLLMGYSAPPPDLDAFVWGHEGEKEAHKLYVKYLEDLGHVNVRTELSGLILDKDCVFLGASPDYLVACDCCVDGIAEVKAPMVTGPMQEVCHSLSFLDTNGNLKQNHNFYYQVQGQLALTGRQWCDFVVLVSGIVKVERIPFDEEHWNTTKPVLIQFFEQFLMPEILSNKHRPMSQVSRVKQHYNRANFKARQGKRKREEECEADDAILFLAHEVTVEGCNSSVDNLVNSLDAVVINANDGLNTGYTSITVPRTGAENEAPLEVNNGKASEGEDMGSVQFSYYCPVCHALCEDSSKTFGLSSIECETCLFWYHMRCVALTKKKLKEYDNVAFKCKTCILASKKK